MNLKKCGNTYTESSPAIAKKIIIFPNNQIKSIDSGNPSLALICKNTLTIIIAINSIIPVTVNISSPIVERNFPISVNIFAVTPRLEAPITLAIAIGFGIYATTQLAQYDREKLQNNSQTQFQEYKEGEVNAKCPKCNSKLMEITNLTKKFTLNSYKGLVYCKECDFEISKNEFDREYM